MTPLPLLTSILAACCAISRIGTVTSTFSKQFAISSKRSVTIIIPGVLILALLASAPSIAAAERMGVPQSVELRQGEGPISWDGRLTMRKCWDLTTKLHGWTACAVRPEAITLDDRGLPDFAAAFSTGLQFAEHPFNYGCDNGTPGDRSDDFIASPYGPPGDLDWYPKATDGVRVDGPTGLTDINAAAIIPDPTVPGRNPIRCNAAGDPDPLGSFALWTIVLFTRTIDFNTIDYSRPENPPGEESRGPADVHRFKYYAADGPKRVGLLRLRVIVRDPETPVAEVDSVTVTETFRELRTVSGVTIDAIEPTATQDGRLLFFHKDSQIMFSMSTRDEQPSDLPDWLTGYWTDPLPIELLHMEGDRMLGGFTAAERYAICREPMLMPNGDPLDYSFGAYPWIDFGGNQLFFTTMKALCESRRAGYSTIGALSGYRLTLIDGPLNPERKRNAKSKGDCDSTWRRNVTTTTTGLTGGIDPGFWGLNHEDKSAVAPSSLMGDLGHSVEYFRPARPQRPIIAIVDGTAGVYQEVALDYRGNDYALYMPFNELLVKSSTIAGYWDVDVRKTPDLSENQLIGRLVGDAAFPQESIWDGEDHNVGFVGQAIIFGVDGAVEVNMPQTAQPRNAATVECFARLADTSSERQLVMQQGRFRLSLDAGGFPRAEVDFAQSSQVVQGAVAITTDVWTHLAFTFDGGDLKLYVDGDEVDTAAAVGSLAPVAAPVVIGGGSGTGDTTLLIDEVRIRRVANTPTEVAASAYLPSSSPATLAQPTPPPLPGWADSSDVRITNGYGWTAAIGDLGRELFFSNRLSLNAAYSCASCHDPSLDFTDGLPEAVGFDGRVLPSGRNTPSIANRVFAHRQFFDGRAPTLDEQVTRPIFDEFEMGIPDMNYLLSNRLNRDPSLAARFDAAFGTGGGATAFRVRRALTSYVHQTITGDSALDTDGLSDNERAGLDLFRGKARCSECHGGPNLSNESFRNTGVSRDNDLVRAAITGRTADEGRVKTPTLRNVAETGPYFHDGSLDTLGKVIEFYDQGGRHADITGAVVGRRDHEMAAIGLTVQEKSDLEAFLRALTGSLDRVQPPLPVDDALEPNDHFGQLARVEMDLTYPQLRINGNDDYFVFEASVDGSVTVRIDFEHSDGDLGLFLFDLSGIIGYSDNSSPTQNYENVSVIPTGGWIGIGVLGMGGAVNHYRLRVN